MDVGRINNNQFIITGMPISTPRQDSIPAVTDKFQAGYVPPFPTTDQLKNLANNRPVQSVCEVASVTEKHSGSLKAGSIFRITENDVQPIPASTDGSYKVDDETGTSIYFGEDAKKYLEQTVTFNRETEIILTRGASISVKVDKETLTFSEPGAIMLGAGATATIKVHEGDVIVTSSEKAPNWYRKLVPGGELHSEFEKLADLNSRLYKCITQKSRFKAEDLQRLMDFGIVEQSKEYPDSVQWDTSIKSDEDIHSRLIEAGFRGQSIDENVKIWYNTIKRKLQSYASGRVAKDKFTPELFGKLISAGILKENRFDNKNAFWTMYGKESQLRSILGSKGFSQAEVEDTIKVWRKTTRSGYDNTGLIWDKGKVVAYSLQDKLNMWNEQDTEWIVNSTEYAGENEPFLVGVSSVRAKQHYDRPVSFNEIRPSERLHRHPIMDEKKQTEAYLLTGGRAVLLTIQNNKPHYTFLNPGDMVIISPGVKHCVLAADGNYEHVCFQVPSAFQYGLIFKEESGYEQFGTSHQALVEGALIGLRQNKTGTISASEILK